jgi:hypothetical protein
MQTWCPGSLRVVSISLSSAFDGGLHCAGEVKMLAQGLGPEKEMYMSRDQVETVTMPPRRSSGPKIQEERIYQLK